MITPEHISTDRSFTASGKRIDRLIYQQNRKINTLAFTFKTILQTLQRELEAPPDQFPPMIGAELGINR